MLHFNAGIIQLIIMTLYILIISNFQLTEERRRRWRLQLLPHVYLLNHPPAARNKTPRLNPNYDPLIVLASKAHSSRHELCVKKFNSSG